MSRIPARGSYSAPANKTPDKAQRAKLAAEGKANKDGSYPTDTKGRAVAAKGRATDAVRAGRMSKGEEKSIDARANRRLGRSGGKRRGK